MIGVMRRLMTRPTGRVLTGGSLLLAALTGCSGHTTTVDYAAPLPRLTVATATAAAAAINLTAPDVPGFTGSLPTVKTVKDKAQAKALSDCYGGVDPGVDIADLSSDDFAKGQGLTVQQASSNVSFVPTVADARQDLAAIRSAKAPACLKTFLEKAVVAGGGSSVTVVSSTIVPLPETSAGTDGAFGFRGTITAKTSGVTFPVYVDLLGCLKGRTEVSLMDLAISAPFPPADRDRLWQALTARTAAKAL